MNTFPQKNPYMPTLLLKCLGFWIAFIPIAILNGLLRERVLAPLLGPSLALPLSGIFCGSLFFLLVYFTLPWFGRLTARYYRWIGLLWLGMTVLFEFLFGRLVVGKSWGEQLSAYNPASGNLWLLVLLVIVLSPSLAGRLRKA